MGGRCSSCASSAKQEYVPVTMPVPPGPAQIDEWVAQCTETPMEPLLEIVDCHHHFFDWSKVSAGDAIVDCPDGFRAGFTTTPAMEPTFGVRNQVFEARHTHSEEDWVAGKVRCHAYMPEQLLKDMEGNNVVGTLFEECFHLVDFAEAESNPLRMTLGEVRAVQKRKEEYAGKPTQLCMGMNAHANLSAGAEAIEPILKEMSKYTVMRGIRESCAGLDTTVPELFSPGETLPGGPMACYDQPAFRSGYALLQKYNLSFDAWCYHKQIPMVCRLARDFPDIPICLCHLGSPVFLEGLTNKPVQPYDSVLAEWKSYIDEAAKCPNMVCKSDALPMAFGPHDWYNRPTPPTSAEVAQRLAPFYMYTSECRNGSAWGCDCCGL